MHPGTVAMANMGKNSNTSQFYITTHPHRMQWLDGSNVVFGRVIKGMQIVREIEKQGTTSGVPKQQVRIIGCGRVKKKSKDNKHDDSEDEQENENEKNENKIKDTETKQPTVVNEK